MGSKEKQIPPATHKWNTGVLLVHGIGEQSRGAAVGQAAGPILEVLQRYAELTGSPAPQIQDADLRPTDGPARLTIGPIYPEGPDRPASTWLVCEAHWADSFAAPSLTRMLWWSFEYGRRVLKRFVLGKKKSAQIHPGLVDFTITLVKGLGAAQQADLPKLLLDEDHWTKVCSDSLVQGGHCTQDEVDAEQNLIRVVVKELLAPLSVLYIQNKWIFQIILPLYTWISKRLLGRFLNFIFGITTILGSILIAMLGIILLPFILLALTLIAVLSVIPGVNSPFRTIRSSFERTVGDAFVFTRDPVGRAAMLSSVRRTAEWIDANCSNYVVVAHSQGSVIVEKLFSNGALHPTEKIIVYGSAIGLLESPSDAWNHSNKWVSYRTPNDPIAPGPLRNRRGLADMLTDITKKWDRQVRGWKRLSLDHTSYWTERETFVVEVVQATAASDSANTLSEWASSVAEKVRTEWTGFTRAKATMIGRIIGALLIIATGAWELSALAQIYGAGPARWVGGMLFGLSAWALDLLPSGIPDVVGWLNNLQLFGAPLSMWVGLGVLGIVAANVTRKLSWAIAAHRSRQSQWLQHTEEALHRKELEGGHPL